MCRIKRCTELQKLANKLAIENNFISFSGKVYMVHVIQDIHIFIFNISHIGLFLVVNDRFDLKLYLSGSLPL